ncbi:MAG: Rho termination factor N-terminal domain-containing protein [Solirubrobacterales bacterium]|nr:Rho termination factor N-terminal domain-containing protein [Solirubrobacterales bacterium]
MSVLDRAALEGSPLADLHAIASELSIDGYRRLRRGDLIDAILNKQAGAAEEADASSQSAPDEPEAADASEQEPEAAGTSGLMEVVADELRIHDGGQPRRRRGRRGGRGRGLREEAAERQQEEDAEEPEQERAEADEPDADDRREPADDGRKRADEGRESADERQERADQQQERTDEEGEPVAEERDERLPDDAQVEGVVELLPNGSGFLRVEPPDPSDDDVYISAAQVKRCELVSGDRISGPRRAPRRSERFASLVRIDTINDRPASEVADSARFDDLPAAFPSERFELGSDDPTIKAIDWLTPLGKGSRVTIVGGSRAGKTEALRRLVAVLAADQTLQLSLVLAGVRPEELSEWSIEPAAAISLAASADAQGQTVERVVDRARRLAARGADAVVLVDTMDGLHPHVARKQLAAARKLLDGGSLTVIATARAPLGGETTVIALDPLMTATGRFPALDPLASGTLRPELLVGEAGAEAITRARAEALEGRATSDLVARLQ